MKGPLEWIEGEIAAIQAASRERRPLHIEGSPGPTVVLDGRELIHLCSNNYLGLAGDERLAHAAAQAVREYGTGSGGSRLVSGGSVLHRALEERLAALEGTEDAVVFSSGYLANVGSIPALAGDTDAIFSDALNHASIIDGCRLSRAALNVYRHGDPSHLDALMARCGALRMLVVTESVFSMDGDLAPLDEIAAICERRGAMLMVDEAHATGLLGATGSGGVERFGIGGRVTACMGTLSKSLGSTGGYVAGPGPVIRLLRNRARTFLFDTALPAASAAAAFEAVRIAGEEPWRRERALALASKLAAGLAEAGFSVTAPDACVVPVHLGSEERALDVSKRLIDQGILAPAIRPPSVPEGTCRLRLTTMATHSDEHIDEAVRAFGAIART